MQVKRRRHHRLNNHQLIQLTKMNKKLFGIAVEKYSISTKKRKNKKLSELS
jgi:hypothetical protein